jgi:hypothetical protein
VDINRVWETIRISKFQLKRAFIIMNWRRLSHGSTKDAQNY